MQSFKQIKFRSLIAKIQVVSLLIVGIAVVPTLSNASVAGITDCKFGRAQIWDTQWNPGFTDTLVTSGYRNIYAGAAKPGEATGWMPLADSDFADGDYFQFFESTDPAHSGSFGIKQFTADGTEKWVIDDWGTFTAAGDNFIFYNGHDSWGTLITTGEGFSAGGSANLPVTLAYPTSEQMASYTSCSSTTLAAGETRSDAPAEPTINGITDCKFGRAQIWDTQWNISGGNLNASGFQNIYAGASKPAEAVGWTPLNNLDFAEGDYFQFFESTVYPNQLGIKQFTSDGALKWVVNEGGSFRAMGDDFIFFNNENNNGTLITTGSGYAADASVSLTVTEENPSVEVMASYTSCASNVLAAGETRGGGSNGGGDGETPQAELGSPTINTITKGTSRKSFNINFNAPADSESLGITNYEYSLDGGDTWITPNPEVISTPILVSGLSYSTTYSVMLRAVNGDGAGAASSVTEYTTPGAPSAVDETVTEIPVDPVPVPTVEPTPKPTGKPATKPTAPVTIKPVTTKITLPTVAPNPIELSPLSSAVTLDGKTLPVTFVKTGTNDGYQLRGGDFNLVIRGASKDKKPAELNADGKLVLTSAKKVWVTGDGFMSNSEIQLWMFSNPTKLQAVKTDAKGNFEFLADLPESAVAGDHTLQVVGLSQDGQLRTASLGVVVKATVLPTAPGQKLDFTWYLALAGLILVLFILILAARRRKKNDVKLNTEMGQIYAS